MLLDLYSTCVNRFSQRPLPYSGSPKEELTDEDEKDEEDEEDEEDDMAGLFRY
jgi:hypothetical protein